MEERGNSPVECRTRNQVSPGSNRYRFEDWAFSFPSLAIDSGENVSDLVVAPNCCMAGMLPGEAELVSE